MRLMIGTQIKAVGASYSRGALLCSYLALPGRATYSLARADEQTPRGWRAPYYNYREPALSLDASVRDRLKPS